MVPKVLARAFASIQCLMDQRHLSNIFDSEFQATHNVVLLGRWCLEIGVAYICCEHLQAAYMKAIRTLARETMPAEVDPIGSGILCLSRTHLAFLVKSILTSQIRCPDAFVQPVGADWPSSSILKATPTLNISRASASLHIVFPFFGRPPLCGQHLLVFRCCICELFFIASSSWLK